MSLLTKVITLLIRHIWELIRLCTVVVGPLVGKTGVWLVRLLMLWVRVRVWLLLVNSFALSRLHVSASHTELTNLLIYWYSTSWLTGVWLSRLMTSHGNLSTGSHYWSDVRSSKTWWVTTTHHAWVISTRLTLILLKANPIASWRVGEMTFWIRTSFWCWGKFTWRLLTSMRAVYSAMTSLTTWLTTLTSTEALRWICRSRHHF